MGSSVQLPTYNWTKNQLTTRGILPGDSIWTFLASSSVSGMCVVRFFHPSVTFEWRLSASQLVVMQPADTVCVEVIKDYVRR